jgi:alkylation response protein AidB-like acyl-CoA dehydrogenase
MLTAPLDLSLDRAELEFLAQTHEVCRRVIVPVRAELDATGEYPAQVIKQLRAAGLFKAVFSAEYDGYGLHPIMPVLVAEVLAEYCLAIATIFIGSTQVAALPILLNGTDAQKQKYLPKLASGEWLAAFAATEPNAGSDITNLATTAVRQGDRYVLNGTKKWITNAGQADLYNIFAVTDPHKDPRAGISCFIVEKDTLGLSFGPLEDKLGLRCAPNRPIILQDVEVPVENLVGGQPNKGFLHLMNSFTRSRIGVAALGVGLATGAYKEAISYTHQRKQFGQRTIEFQVVQHMLADMLVKIEAARALTYKAGWYALVAARADAMQFSAMAKYYSSEIAMQVATDALQLHGGYGFVKEAPIEKMFRDAKILAIYEGTSQMLKTQIAASALQAAGPLK